MWNTSTRPGATTSATANMDTATPSAAGVSATTARVASATAGMSSPSSSATATSAATASEQVATTECQGQAQTQDRPGF